MILSAIVKTLNQLNVTTSMKISHIRTVKFSTPDHPEAYVRVFYGKIDDKWEIDLNQTHIIQGMGRRRRLTSKDHELLTIRLMIMQADLANLPEHYLIVEDEFDSIGYVEMEYRMVRLIDEDKREQNFDVRFFHNNYEEIKVDEVTSYVRNANRKLSRDELAFVRIGLRRVLVNFKEQTPLLFNVAGDQYVIDKKARDFEYASAQQRKKYGRELIRSQQLTLDQSNKIQATFNSDESLALVADIYDAANRFVNNRPDHTASLTPILTRDFSVRGEDYKMVITSAQLENEQGETVRKFAGRTEAKVEAALRRLLSKKGAVQLGALTGLDFSLTEVEKELALMNFSLSIANIRDAINILHKTSVSIENISKVRVDSIFDGSSSTYLPNLLWGANGDRHFVTFHVALMTSVAQLDFRAWNPYSENKAIKSAPNTESILKILYLNWTNASEKNSYTPKMSTLLRMAGIYSGDFRADRQKTIRVLKQLTEKKDGITVLRDWEITDVIKKDGKNFDLHLRLHAGKDFVKQMKKISRLKNDMIDAISNELADEEQQLRVGNVIDGESTRVN